MILTNGNPKKTRVRDVMPPNIKTIHAYSNAIDELTEFYENSRETLEKILDDWGDILISLRNYKKIPESEEKKQEITV